MYDFPEQTTGARYFSAYLGKGFVSLLERMHGSKLRHSQECCFTEKVTPQKHTGFDETLKPLSCCVWDLCNEASLYWKRISLDGIGASVWSSLIKYM